MTQSRRRTHEHLHERSLEAQTLDALLRLEELMEKLVAAGAVRVQDEVQVDLSDAKQAEVVKEAFKKPVTTGKRRTTQL